MKILWSLFFTFALMESLLQPTDGRDSTTTEMSSLRFFLNNVFRPRIKPVKAGIVEPSAIDDSPELSDSRSLDLGDFLSEADKRVATGRFKKKGKEGGGLGGLLSLFRLPSLPSLPIPGIPDILDDEPGFDTDRDADQDDDLDLEPEIPTTRRPSLILRGARRLMQSLRSSSASGWRSFIRRLLPAFFP